MGCSNSKATKVAEPTNEKSKLSEKPLKEETKETAVSVTAQTKVTDDVKSAQEAGTTPSNDTTTQKEDCKTKMEEELQKLCEAVKSNKILVGYWGIKGRAYPIRLLLTYKGVDFEDRCYYKDTAPTWFGSDKPEIGSKAKLNFPSIPFIVDRTECEPCESGGGDGEGQCESGEGHKMPTIVFQSMAVQRYLGRKYDLCTKTDQEMALEDMFEGVFKDIGDAMQKAVFGGDEEMQTWKDAFTNVWAPIDLHLSSHKFITGENLTTMDFVLFSHIEMVEGYNEGCFKDMANICRFKSCIMENENICKYVESRKKQPFFPPK